MVDVKELEVEKSLNMFESKQITIITSIYYTSYNLFTHLVKQLGGKSFT